MRRLEMRRPSTRPGYRAGQKGTASGSKAVRLHVPRKPRCARDPNRRRTMQTRGTERIGRRLVHS